MPYAKVAEQLKSLNEIYLQKASDYILYLQSVQNSQKENSSLEREEAIKIFKSFRHR